MPALHRCSEASRYRESLSLLPEAYSRLSCQLPRTILGLHERLHVSLRPGDRLPPINWCTSSPFTGYCRSLRAANRPALGFSRLSLISREVSSDESQTAHYAQTKSKRSITRTYIEGPCPPEAFPPTTSSIPQHNTHTQHITRSRQHGCFILDSVAHHTGPNPK